MKKLTLIALAVFGLLSACTKSPCGADISAVECEDNQQHIGAEFNAWMKSQ